MAPRADHSHALHCSHCGRVVQSTMHGRDDFHVDYYELHAGEVEEAVLAATDDEPERYFVRVTKPARIVTCRDCYATATVRAERERLFRPEAAGADDGRA